MAWTWRLSGVEAQRRKKRTITINRCVAAEIRRDPRKSIWELAAEHNMAVNSMKRVVNKDFEMHSMPAKNDAKGLESYS
jgi:hypothetical protein